MNQLTLPSSVLLLALLSPLATSQSFNIDIGAAGTPLPSSSYAAAGLAGQWNAVVLPHTTPSQAPQAFDELLFDLNGNPTAARVHQFGGQDWMEESHPGLTGDDAALLGDGLVTHSTQLDSCLYINGLQNGVYEVLCYMWRPNHPEVIHKSKIDTVPDIQLTQGSWTGAHAEGVTYTRTFVVVSNGFMGPHMGLTPVGDTALGGAVNAVQLRLIECTSSNFCSSSVNSTGAAASISSNADCSVEANSFVLSASPVPNEFGFFFYASSQISGGSGVPFGNGRRCVGGAGSTVYRLPVTLASGNSLDYALDFTQATGAGGAIDAGSTWHFQAWFRDPAAGGANFDLSDGLTVGFH